MVMDYDRDDDDTPQPYEANDDGDLAQMDAIQWLNHTAKTTPGTELLSASDEYALAMRAHGGDEGARRELVQRNIRLALSIALRYMHRGLDLEDLRQEAILGLMHAAEKFDPTRGFKFSTYAYHWIRQAITRACEDKGHTIRMPVHAQAALGQIVRTRQQLTLNLEREPTANEIADALDFDIERVYMLTAAGRRTLSLDEPAYGADEVETLLDLIEDGDVTPVEQSYEAAETRADMRVQLAALSARERLVVTLRFGLDGAGERTLDEVGRAFTPAITRERARQIEGKALEKLRRAMGAPAMLTPSGKPGGKGHTKPIDKAGEPRDLKRPRVTAAYQQRYDAARDWKAEYAKRKAAKAAREATVGTLPTVTALRVSQAHVRRAS